MASPKRKGVFSTAMAALPLYQPDIDKWMKAYHENMTIQRGLTDTLFIVAHDPTLLMRKNPVCSPKAFAQCFAAEPDFVAAFLGFARDLIRRKRQDKRHLIQEWILEHDWRDEVPDSYGKNRRIEKLNSSEIADRLNEAHSLSGPKCVTSEDVRSAERALRKLLK